MSDIDEDLLALAGEDDVSDNGAPKHRSNDNHSKGRDDIDDDDDDDLEELALGTKRKRSNKHIDRDDEEDEEFEDDDIKESSQIKPFNKYPLENKYIDEKDKEYLLSLTEIERETILFDRLQEIENYKLMSQLSKRAEERDQQKAQATRTSKREKVSTSSKKQSKLSELRKQREEKHNREKTGRPNVPYRGHGSDDEDDDSGSYDDEYDSDDNRRHRGDNDDDFIEDDERDSRKKSGSVEWAKPQKAPELTLNDINKIRFGRSLFAKYCHNPGFESVVVGTFVRVNIGFDREKQKPVYRICQVVSVEPSKPYTFQNRTVDEVLRVASGKNEKNFEMGICSDSPFTEDEFRWWKHNLSKGGISLPSVKSINRKYDELMEFKNHTLTDAEVMKIVERRQKLSATSGVGVSRILQKSALQEQRLIALSENDLETVEKIDRQLASLEAKPSRSSTFSSGLSSGNLGDSSHDVNSGSTSSLDKLAAVNQRNRRANVSGIRQAELKNVEERRKSGKNNTGDPFSRVRTSAKIFHKSFDENEAASTNSSSQKESENDKKEAEAEAKKRRLAAKMAYNHVDDMIAKIDFALEIEI